MADWNASQYLKFKKQRTQPAIDLARRMIGTHPQTIVDIGCGPGNSTFILKKTFPDAQIIGIDRSPNMVETAKSEYPDIEFCLCEAQALDGTYDLLFSNACLQWIPHHERLIPSLMDKLNDGGLLAVQIPMNNEEPLYRLIEEVAMNPKWGLQEAALPPNDCLTPDEYAAILSICSSSFDIWETVYYHFLPDHKALVEWVKGTRIRPYMDYLGDEKGALLENEITEKAKEIYPLMKNGELIFKFKRFFFVAQK